MKNKLNKIIEYLLYFFVFLIPWQTRWIIWNPKISEEVWEYGRIAIYGFDVIFVILFISFLVCSFIKRKGKKEREKKKGKILLVACCLFFVVLNFIFAENKLLSFYWLLRILQGIVLVWILSKIKFLKVYPVRSTELNLENSGLFDGVKLAWSFVISMTLSASLGVYQFLTQSTFANKWLGLAFHSSEILGNSVVETATGRWLRAYGSFPHPNIFAGFLIVAVIFCFYLYSILFKKYQKNVLIILFLILSAGLFFTFSRAGWLAFIIVILLDYYFVRKKSEIRNPSNSAGRQKLGFVFLCFCVFVFLSVIYFPLVKTRFQNSARLEVKSNIERINNLEQSFEIIKNNLWLGTGIGNYTVELQKMCPDQPAYFYQPAHNVYLLVLSEIGIVGFFLIIIILIYYFFSKKLEIRNQKFKIVFLCLGVFLFLFLFDHFWWTLPSGLLIIFLIAGLFFKLDKKINMI